MIVINFHFHPFSVNKAIFNAAMRITKENNEDMNVAAAFVSWPVTKLLRID